MGLFSYICMLELKVEVWSTIFFEHVLGIQGRFVKSGDEFTIFNVYAPCDSNRQQVLWQNLAARLASLHDQNVCVCGDFNVVRYVEESRSVGIGVPPFVSVNFNQFIVDSCLVDLPLRGRRYTWFRGDGKSMSRLDRFLLPER
jgi:exonuclease III